MIISPTVHGNDGVGAHLGAHDVDRQHINIAAVHQHVSVGRVADGRQVARQRHAGAHIAPQRAVLVDAPLAGRDVGAVAKVRQPQILNQLVLERILNQAEGRANGRAKGRAKGEQKCQK